MLLNLDSQRLRGRGPKSLDRQAKKGHLQPSGPISPFGRRGHLRGGEALWLGAVTGESPALDWEYTDLGSGHPQPTA